MGPEVWGIKSCYAKITKRLISLLFWPQKKSEEIAQVYVLVVCSLACVKVLICSIVGFPGMYAFHEAEKYGNMIDDKENLSP